MTCKLAEPRFDFTPRACPAVRKTLLLKRKIMPALALPVSKRRPRAQDGTAKPAYSPNQSGNQVLRDPVHIGGSSSCDQVGDFSPP
ncbi:MAG TPA: hypothetical protein VFE35_03725 [Candidatus Cybelea sp.]|nr:hypothetical protein [Candidatus Cybelea sp.]